MEVLGGCWWYNENQILNIETTKSRHENDLHADAQTRMTWGVYFTPKPPPHHVLHRLFAIDVCVCVRVCVHQ